MLLPRFHVYKTNQSSHRYGEAKALPPRIASEWFRLRSLNLLGRKGMLFGKAIVSSTPFQLKTQSSKPYYDIFSRIAQLEDVSIDDQKTILSLGFASFGKANHRA